MRVRCGVDTGVEQEVVIGNIYRAGVHGDTEQFPRPGSLQPALA